MEFVWDENKAAINLQKHGVSFQEASTVFEDYDALCIFTRIIPKRKIGSSCLV